MGLKLHAISIMGFILAPVTGRKLLVYNGILLDCNTVDSSIDHRPLAMCIDKVSERITAIDSSLEKISPVCPDSEQVDLKGNCKSKWSTLEAPDTPSMNYDFY
jgi:hypothetical protein